jgi:16S rRNA (cytosine1402-N4)-methyltransferase
MEGGYHIPALAQEVSGFLPVKEDLVIVDGTLGGGGHAERMLEQAGKDARLIAFDLDEDAIVFARKRLERFGEQVTYVHDNFRNIAPRLAELGIFRVDFLLLDLGVSSHQIDTAERGFSFQKVGKIDMRMNSSQHLNGSFVLNTYEEPRLADIFYRYGEERQSRRIAAAIAAVRRQHQLTTTDELTEVVHSVAGGGPRGQKSLARIFQALRIEVNGELENLRVVLARLVDCLSPRGRVAVISYHSLEDRIVKEYFRDNARTFIKSSTKLLPDTEVRPNLKLMTKKPIEPSEEETERNPRSRSAKMRVAERI